MADGIATLRVVSPCEHGVHHHLKSVVDGSKEFSVPECRDSKGKPKLHRVTPDRYPETERRK